MLIVASGANSLDDLKNNEQAIKAAIEGDINGSKGDYRQVFKELDEHWSV